MYWRVGKPKASGKTRDYRCRIFYVVPVEMAAGELVAEDKRDAEEEEEEERRQGAG